MSRVHIIWYQSLGSKSSLIYPLSFILCLIYTLISHFSCFCGCSGIFYSKNPHFLLYFKFFCKKVSWYFEFATKNSFHSCSFFHVFGLFLYYFHFQICSCCFNFQIYDFVTNVRSKNTLNSIFIVRIRSIFMFCWFFVDNSVLKKKRRKKVEFWGLKKVQRDCCFARGNFEIFGKETEILEKAVWYTLQLEKWCNLIVDWSLYL